MIRALLPALAITGVSLMCPNLKNSGEDVPLRPPGWVFGVVWPILYATTGYAWYLSKKDTLYAFIVGLCCLWLIAYSCTKNKDKAPAIIVSAAVMSWYTVSQVSGKARAYTYPIAFWLTFASYLNIYEQYILQ